MKRSTARWTTAMAAAALIGLPAIGFAQATTPQTPPSQTSPAQTTPTPTSTQGQTSASATSAADHVREAKQALAAVPPTSVPAASRAKLGQLRTHLNNLDRLVAHGGQAATSGTAASKSGANAKKGGAANWGTEAAAIDKLVSELTAESTDDTAKQKLMEVRRHITELAGSMSGAGQDQASAAGSTASPDTMGAKPSASSQQPTPTSAAANPTPTATDPSAAGATPTSSVTNPSAASQPPSATTPQSIPSQQPTTSPSAPQGQMDPQAAKQHLSEARDSLAQLTSLPEAAKLQGEARTQISQLISNFNELITTQSDWKTAYAKVSANLDTLLGPDASSGATGMTGTAGAPPATAGTTGATGAAGPAMQIDPAIKAKLQDFRTHLKEFEQAAGGASVESGLSRTPQQGANPSASTGAMAPRTAAPEPTNAPMSTGTAGAAGAPGAVRTSGTAAPAPTDNQSKASAKPASGREGHSEADKHLDAIQDILNKSKDGTLDKAQTDQIKMHLEQLRQLIAQAK